MATLISFDQELFLLINGAHSAFLDFIMYWCSDKWIWTPAYAILLFLIVREFKGRTWMVLLGVVLLVVFTDQLSVKLFKDIFMRLRPCHEPALEGMVRTLYGQCGGKYGFISSHAANTFGLALFSGLILRRPFKWLLPLMIFWAFLVSYSRIYLGVHYPGDILGGALVGGLLGFIMYKFTHFLLQKSERREIYQ